MEWKKSKEKYFEMAGNWGDTNLEEYKFCSDIINNSLIFSYKADDLNRFCSLCFKRDLEMLNEDIVECVEFRCILNDEIFDGIFTVSSKGITILTEDFSETIDKDVYGYRNVLYSYSNNKVEKLCSRTLNDDSSYYKRK